MWLLAHIYQWWSLNMITTSLEEGTLSELLCLDCSPWRPWPEVFLLENASTAPENFSLISCPTRWNMEITSETCINCKIFRKFNWGYSSRDIINLDSKSQVITNHKDNNHSFCIETYSVHEFSNTREHYVNDIGLGQNIKRTNIPGDNTWGLPCSFSRWSWIPTRILRTDHII